MVATPRFLEFSPRSLGEMIQIDDHIFLDGLKPPTIVVVQLLGFVFFDDFMANKNPHKETRIKQRCFFFSWGSWSFFFWGWKPRVFKEKLWETCTNCTARYGFFLGSFWGAETGNWGSFRKFQIKKKQLPREPTWNLKITPLKRKRYFFSRTLKNLSSHAMVIQVVKRSLGKWLRIFRGF